MPRPLQEARTDSAPTIEKCDDKNKKGEPRTGRWKRCGDGSGFGFGECATGAQQCSKALREDHNPQCCTRPVSSSPFFPVENFVFGIFFSVFFCLFLLILKICKYPSTYIKFIENCVFVRTRIVILFCARSDTRRLILHVIYRHASKTE